MSETKIPEAGAELSFEYHLDAPLEKVWRALSLAEFRNRWLPKDDLLDGVPKSVVDGEEISFRMRESKPPHLESTVVLQIRESAEGGTILTIVHELVDSRNGERMKESTNENTALLMMAA